MGKRAFVEMKRRILLADDDESVRIMVGRVLESEDYEVVLARTGREAISRALSGAPDLVLLDITMPDKNGWEAFELIDRIHPFVPVIVITARPNQHDYATQVGIDALMEKPLDLALLLKTIRARRKRTAHPATAVQPPFPGSPVLLLCLGHRT